MLGQLNSQRSRKKSFVNETNLQQGKREGNEKDMERVNFLKLTYFLGRPAVLTIRFTENSLYVFNQPYFPLN